MLPDHCPWDPDPTLEVSNPIINESIDYIELASSFFFFFWSQDWFDGHFSSLPSSNKYMEFILYTVIGLIMALKIPRPKSLEPIEYFVI